MMGRRWSMMISVIFLLLILIMGCGMSKKALREELQIMTTKRLKSRVGELEKEKEALEKMKTENKKIKEEFQDYTVKSQIEIQEAQKGLVISLIDKVVFDSGRAEIKPRAYPVLEKVAQIIGDHPNRPVLIEGHTDNKPIKHSSWKSNWELSSARAVTILRYLMEKHNLSPKQLAVAGYAEYHPIDSNKTAEGRRKNRRVEIVIMPEKITRKQ